MNIKHIVLSVGLMISALSLAPVAGFAAHGGIGLCDDGQEFADASHKACVDEGQGLSLDNDFEADCTEQNLTSENCGIVAYMVIGINFLTAVAGMAIVGSIMFAGFIYMTARDNAGQINKAKMRILWTMIALGVLIFTYAILNFLVPGGVI